MKPLIFRLAVCVPVLALSAVLGGCASHHHESHYSHEYSDDRAARPTETERERAEGDWHMAQPGTMVVDPNRR